MNAEEARRRIDNTLYDKLIRGTNKAIKRYHSNIKFSFFKDSYTQEDFRDAICNLQDKGYKVIQQHNGNLIDIDISW